MKLEELEDIESGQQAVELLTKLNTPEIVKPKFSFSVGHYDGPVTGVFKMDGRFCWFQRAQEGEADIDGEPTLIRLFAVVELTDEEYTEQLERHKLWRKYVNNYTTYDKNGERMEDSWVDKLRRRVLRRSSDKYYKLMAGRQHLDYSNHEVIAWWLQGQFSFDALFAKAISDLEG